jgi:hypothetical protein
MKSFTSDSTNRDPFNIEPEDYETRNFEQAGLLPSDYTKKTPAARILENYFEDPYPRKYKARLAQAQEFDYVVSASTDVLIQYILGRDFKATVYPISRNTLNNQQEIDQALSDEGLDLKARDKLQTYIDKVDLNCELKTMLKGALSQKFTYGRAALWIKRAKKDIETYPELADFGFKEGTPTQLLPLNSYYLGQVYSDVDTWEPTGVLYEEGKIFGMDPSTNKPYKTFDMPIEDIIYFTHRNYNIVPKSFNYGMALLQTIMPVSEVNRRLNERVFPEINTSSWAGTGIIHFDGLNTREMDAFVQAMMAPGNWKGTNQQATIETHKLPIDGQFLLDQRNENIRQALMQLRIPSVLMNFENVTNRATTEAVLTVWQETVLEAERDALRDTMWKYWYRPLMEHYFDDGTGNPQPGKAFMYLRIKVLMEFQSIDFSSLIEKAVSIQGLVASGIISVREGREILKLPPFPPDQEAAIDTTTKLLQQHPDMIQKSQDQQRQDEQMAKQAKQQGQQPQQQTGPVKLSKSLTEGNITTKLIQRAKNKAKSGR